MRSYIAQKTAPRNSHSPKLETKENDPGYYLSAMGNQAAIQFINSKIPSQSRADKELESSLRDRLSARFNTDLSGIEVYRDQGLENSQIGERAYSHGREIHIDSRINPLSDLGNRIVMHEAAHILQQGMGQVLGSGFVTDISAENQAQSVANGGFINTAGFSMPNAGAAAPVQGEGFLAKLFGAFKKKPKEELREEPKPLQGPMTQDWAALKDAGERGNQDQIREKYGVIAGNQRAAVTTAQRDMFNDYIEDSRPLNAYLRQSKTRDKSLDAQYAAQSREMSEVMPETGTDLTAYRGVSDVALASLLKQSKSRSLRRAVRRDGTIDHRQFTKNMHKLEGMEFSDAGFGSTSMMESYAETWRKGIAQRERDTLLAQRTRAKYGRDALTEMGPIPREELASAETQRQIDSYSIMRAEETGELEKIQADLAKRDIGAHMYQINVPRGQKAGLIDKMRTRTGRNGPVDTDAGQGELLIDKNARYKVSRVEQMLDESGVPKANQYRIIMDIMRKEEQGVPR